MKVITSIFCRGIPEDRKVDPDAESASLGTIKHGETIRKLLK